MLILTGGRRTWRVWWHMEERDTRCGRCLQMGSPNTQAPCGTKMTQKGQGGGFIDSDAEDNLAQTRETGVFNPSEELEESRCGVAHHALCFPILKLEGTWDPPEVAKPGLGVGLESGRWLSDPWQDKGPAQCWLALVMGTGIRVRPCDAETLCQGVSLPLRSRRN